MRSPAGSIRNHLVNSSDGYSSTHNRIVVTTPYVGQLPTPSISDIINELKGAIASCLMDLRGSSSPVKDRAVVISHLCRSITCLVGIGAIEKVDLTKMSDKELVELSRKLLSDVRS